MAHVTKLMKYEVLDNGQIHVVIRCDADKSTDYPATMDAAVAADSTQLSAKLNEYAQMCRTNHQAALDAQAGVLPLVGTDIPNTPPAA